MSVGRLVRIDCLKDPARSIVAATEYFLGYCRASNLSPNTIGYYQYRLRAFSRYLDDNAPGVGPRDVTRQMIREFVNWELQHASPSTVNHSITTLRAFFNLLAADGLILESPLTGLKKVKQPRRLIQTFSPEQVEALLATCGTNFAGVRDKAMLLLLYDCGPRASELTGLRLEDVNWSERTINLVGKGDKERIIPFGETARRALAVYLARRPELGNDFLFVSCFGEPIDRHRLLAMIKERCAAAKISGPRCSPHTLRHSFAINYLRGGGDLFSLQKILGHTDLSMTRRYAELSTTDVREKHRAHSPADRLKPAEPSKGRKRIYSVAHQWAMANVRANGGLIVVDYLQKVIPDNEAASREEKVSATAGALKNLARRLEVGVATASQFSKRKAGDTRRSNNDLRESGAIEHEADKIILVQPQGQIENGIQYCWLEVSKHRNGRVGRVPAAFNKRLTRFNQVEPHQLPEPEKPRRSQKAWWTGGNDE